MKEGRSAFKILTGKHIGNIHVGRPRLRWEDNIRMDLKGISINRRKLIHFAQGRDYLRALVNVTLNLRVP